MGEQESMKEGRNACHDIRSNQYQQQWALEMFSAPCSNPGFCCYATLCCCFASMKNRKRAIYNDMSRYLCCGGFYPCSGRCYEQSNPELCLCLEAFCCFSESVIGTRLLLQDEMQIQNSKCDNCLIGFMIFMQYLSCICRLAACISGNDELDAMADAVECVADLTYCSVCACMQTQHHEQLNFRDNNPGAVKVALGVPPCPCTPRPRSRAACSGGRRRPRATRRRATHRTPAGRSGTDGEGEADGPTSGQTRAMNASRSRAQSSSTWIR